MTQILAPAERQAVLIGSESLLIECARTLVEHGFGIAAVVSAQAPVRRWAASQGLMLFDRPEALLEAQAPRGFGYLFCITHLERVVPEVLALATRAAINFHDGPLPEYAGLNTPVWALLNGEREHGVTWHLMTDRVDRGDILAQRRFAIAEHETALTLNTRCFEAGIESFVQVARGLAEGTLVPRPQQAPPGRLYKRKDRPLAVIDGTSSAADSARLVRALDFGPYANPVASAKLLAPRGTLLVGAAEAMSQRSSRPAGTVVALDESSIVIATIDHDLRLAVLHRTCGSAIDAHTAAREYELQVGASVLTPSEAVRAQLDAAAAHEPFWSQALETQDALELPLDRSQPAGREVRHADLSLAAPLRAWSPAQRMASVLAWLARCADKSSFDIGHGDASPAPSHPGLFARQRPWRAQVAFEQTFETLAAQCAEQQQSLQRRGPYLDDIVARRPALRARAVQRDPRVLPVALLQVDRLDDAAALPGNELTIALTLDGSASRWLFDSARLDAARVGAMQRQWLALAGAAAAAPQRTLAELPLMDAALQRQVLHDWQGAADSTHVPACVHRLFEQQAARTPQRTALVAQGVEVTYAELDARANRVAARLVAGGVKPDALVGLCMPRGIELIVGLLAIHKAGGAYVPLDPAYPRERIAYMLDDSKAALLLTDRAHARLLGDSTPTLWIEDALCSPGEAMRVDGGARPEHLAYVIYTSGSTGRPKGVMVEHRNVANFVAGMDAHLDAGAAGTWLAVTSLSFDISVLELCWTLARGYTVVVASEEQKLGAGSTARPAHATRPLDFSLFYFSADENESAQDKYRLLLEGARFADRNGFAAVWTPERHFHAFGGLYPNPAVAGAAVAAITERVAIRAGSVVLPLHHPARVAEEWSVVDNISNGRVGISFASGWQPNDFALMPGNFADNKGVLLRNIETVRKLWRGESVAFDGPLGKPVELRTLPRPVQKELPYWVTSAGNPQTFIDAGRIGANVLTHLLGQTVEELGAKIAAYRKAYKEAGHAGEGFVSLMLHSFVGPDMDVVRATVKRPLIDYLKTSLHLVKQYAWSFPAFKRKAGMDAKDQGSVDLQSLSTDEMDALLEHSFERYFEGSGLFGTPQSCLPMIDRIKSVGVDDVACLIDFGIASDTVLAHLPHLNALREASMPAPAADASLAELMARHRITHLQCTPSLARVLAGDEAARAGLARLDCMMVGGEAFPPSLARELASLVRGKVMNMYGPTETTIWSTVHNIGHDDAGVIPLGRPLAHQQVHILDSRLQPLPPGVPGELAIGGAGVVRGYFQRPELTAERFVANGIGGEGRLYRTGDLARRRDDGVLEFLGRLDHQVKVRGYRIELGEIEAALAEEAGVAQAVVLAREDEPGDARLVAYLVARAGAAIDAAALREALRARLPDFMLPQAFVVLAEFPHTPNGKIDRKALPAPEANAAPVASAVGFVAPAGELEDRIAEVWKDVLKLAQVGTRDNFFDLGGHSLLAVQAHRRLKDSLQRDLSITDIFRFPTIQSLAAYLADGTPGGAQQGSDRAQGRRAALQRRQQQRGAVPATTTTR